MPTQTLPSTSAHDLQPDRQADLLQPAVFATIDLALSLKQLHWNLRGKTFQIIHEFLDQVIEHARDTSDALAERMVALGKPARGQSNAVATNTPLSLIADGFLSDAEATRRTVELLEATISTLRDAQVPLGEIDAVTEDLVIAAIQTFEKQLWMLRSHLL